MVDRLILNDERIEAMAEGIEVIVELDDPVGKERVIGTRPNGIEIKKMRIPLGVVRYMKHDLMLLPTQARCTLNRVTQ